MKINIKNKCPGNVIIEFVLINKESEEFND